MSHFLVDVEKSEKKEMLGKAVNECNHLMSSFVGDAMNYFWKLICDDTKSFAAKVQGAKLLYKFFSSKLDDIAGFELAYRDSGNTIYFSFFTIQFLPPT